MTELTEKRTSHSKTFDNGDGTYTLSTGVGPVHYQDDPFIGGDWKDIDLTVNLTPGESWDASCETNGYQVRFWQTLVRDTKTFRYVAQYRRAGRWLGMAPVALIYENNVGQRQVVSLVQPVGAPVIDNVTNTVRWNNAFGPGIHFQYNLKPDHFFKTVVIDAKANLPAPTIGSGGRKLTVVMALEWDSGTGASNGFATGVTTGLSNGYTDAPDETLTDPATFDYRDGRGALWFLQHPRAWDSAEPRNEVPIAWRMYRKGTATYAGFSVTQAAVNAAVYPLYIDASVTLQVGTGTDDGHHDGTTFTTAGSTMYLGSYFASECMYARFPSVAIPQGASVSAAAMSFYAYASNSATTVQVRLYLNDADNATAPTSVATYNALAVTGYVDWTIPAWTINTWYDSPDIAARVGSVVGRAGWASGNALMVLVKDNGSTPYSSRSCYSYDGWAAWAPKLTITYTAGATSNIKTVNGLALSSIKSTNGVTAAVLKTFNSQGI